MVLSVNIPLKPSEEAIINFLISLVFGAFKKQSANRAQFLRHDVAGASKLIHWILNCDTKNRKSFAMVCNLVYGNTIVLEAQVCRLLYDAVRARDILVVSSFDAQDAERKHKIKELMEIGSESEPASKIFKLPTLPGPSNMVLKQNITIPDAVSLRNSDDDQMIIDELPPVSEEDYALLFEQSTNLEREPLFESQQSEPTYAPLLEKMLENIEFSKEEEKRKSFEDEMEEFRDMGMMKDEELLEVPSQIQLDDDVIIPKKIEKNVVKIEDSDEIGGDNCKIPLKEYGRMMHNYSQLHYFSTKCLIQSDKSNEMSMAELLNPIPFILKNKCNKNLWNPFKSVHNKYDPGFLADCSFSENEEEEISVNETSRKLAPIDLSENYQDIEEIEVPRERIQAFLEDVEDWIEPPMSPEFHFIEEPMHVFRSDLKPESERNDTEEGVKMIESTERSICDIKTTILKECKCSEPLPTLLDTFIPSNCTRRDASRVFYSVLELLKERRLVASQSTEFGNVELTVL